MDGTFAFALGNGGDTVRVRCGGNELDAVAYDDGDLFPDARRASISRDDADRWCLGVDVYLPAGNGVDEHYGTPGAANPECPAE